MDRTTSWPNQLRYFATDQDLVAATAACLMTTFLAIAEQARLAVLLRELRRCYSESSATPGSLSRRFCYWWFFRWFSSGLVPDCPR